MVWGCLARVGVDGALVDLTEEFLSLTLSWAIGHCRELHIMHTLHEHIYYKKIDMLKSSSPQREEDATLRCPGLAITKPAALCHQSRDAFCLRSKADFVKESRHSLACARYGRFGNSLSLLGRVRCQRYQTSLEDSGIEQCHCSTFALDLHFLIQCRSV